MTFDYYVYMVRCSDNTLYTGITNNLQKRIHTHNMGKGAKYTRPLSRRPCSLVYSEFIGPKGKALSREYAIKQLTKQKKEELIIEQM